MRKAIIAATSLLVACMPDENAVECTSSADCNLAAGGTCDVYSATGNSWCSYGSPDCAGGRVWGSESVGDGLAGTCVQVAPSPDAPAPPDGGIAPDADLTGTPAGCWAISWVKEQGGFTSPDNPLGLNDRLMISETAAAFRSREYFEGELDHTGTLTSDCFSVPAGADYDGAASDFTREAYSLCLSDGVIGGAIQWHKPSSPSGDIRYRLSGVPTDPPCE
jgi:hypothetical protein